MNTFTHRSPFLALLALLAVLTAMVVAGCGADTRRAETITSTAASKPPPSRPTEQLATTPVSAKASDPARRAYVNRADGVCSRLDRERNAAREQTARATDTAQATKAYGDSIALGEKQLRQIEAIPRPPGDAALLRTNVFDVLKRQLAIRRQMQRALATTDVPRLKTLRAELDNLTQSLVGFARGYGFQTCGED